MSIFLTGSTGYIGAHIASNLLTTHSQRVNLLVRAKDRDEAFQRLWRSMQLHLDFDTFSGFLHSGIEVFLGDLTEPRFGLADADYDRLVESTDSVIHCAASLNRKSEKACLNVNLRGTLEMVKLARKAADSHGLQRISHVSTVAVCGERLNEVVTEDESIDWNRSDYDPYARTKKFCEHMIRELLPDVPRTIFRPSIVLGDSRRAETTQFDMVRAFVFLASLPVLPFRPDDRIDIVPVEYVADSVAAMHLAEAPKHDIYHLSSGTGSQTFRELTRALAEARGKRGPTFQPMLEKPLSRVVDSLSRYRSARVGKLATLLKVFIPYLVWNTVFDNSRIVEAMGRSPAKFSEYCYPLLKFSRDNNFSYPYKPYPIPTGAPVG